MSGTSYIPVRLVSPTSRIFPPRVYEHEDTQRKMREFWIYFFIFFDMMMYDRDA